MGHLAMGQGRADEGPGGVHLIGDDGRGMAGLAGMLADRGCVVTGPVVAHGPGARPGVRAHAGHVDASIPRSARLLVYGPGVPREHPDRLRAGARDVEQASCRAMLGRFVGRGVGGDGGAVGIVAVGGRRAGVAAAMVGWTLAHAGLDPSLLLAGRSPQLGSGGRAGRGPHLVVGLDGPGQVADLPGARVVLVLGDEGDGDDAPDRAAILRRWAAVAAPGGYVLGLAEAGDPTGESVDGVGVEVERFSTDPGHGWWGADVREERGCRRFRAFHRGRFAMEVRLRVPGLHPVVAALAAAAICDRLGLGPRAIKEALEEFAGVSRGFESRGSYRGVTLVDDEAAGPRGVGEALRVARQVYGRRRLCAAYRPGALGSEAGPSASACEFDAADSVLVVDEEGPPGAPVARALAEGLEAAGRPGLRMRAAGLDGAIRELDRHLEPGDVLVTLGAGDVGTIADAFLRRLSRDRHA